MQRREIMQPITFSSFFHKSLLYNLSIQALLKGKVFVLLILTINLHVACLTLIQEGVAKGATTKFDEKIKI